MGGEEALPQRPNARRRLREKAQEADTLVDSAIQPGDNAYGTADNAAGGIGGIPDNSEWFGGDNDQKTGGPAEEDEAQPQARRSSDGALAQYRSAAVGNFKFEYLDHTADVQLHAWGVDLKEAFEQCALAMFNYMSPLKHVRQRESRAYRAEGHDLQSLLFAFLDELLFVFATELFLAASITITRFDREAFVIEAEGRGEVFDRSVHEVGTEIKAITYSAMAISEREGDAEVFVIVDI